MQTQGQDNGFQIISEKTIGDLKESPHQNMFSRLLLGQDSPIRLFIIAIVGIFLAEVVAMVIVYFLGPFTYIQFTLIDALIMSVLIFPLLYFLSFRPLLRYLRKSRQAEAALIRSMELQERFFDSIDTLIAYMDRDFNFIRVNNAYARLNEKQPEFFVGKNHFDLFPHTENQVIFQRVVESGEAFSVNEKPFGFPQRPETGITYWNWSLLPVWEANGVVEGVVLSLVDVTERVRAEERNRLLSSIVEQTADSVVVTDCDGVIQYVNPAFEINTGYTRAEAAGQTPRLLKSGMQDVQFYQNLWETILSGQVFQSELANRKKNGEIFYEVKTITPLRDEQGDITHFVATGKDITAHKQAEKELRRAYEELEQRVQERTEELRIAISELEAEVLERRRTEQAIRESEEKYRSLFNNMSEGFALHEILFDAEGKPVNYLFIEINDAFEELTGILREKALGKTVKEVLPQIEPYWIETYSRVAQTGEPVRFESYNAALGKWYEAYCYSPRKNQFAVLFFDITERKQAEEQLRYQSTLLSNVNDAIVASDAQYNITLWNASAESVYGWKREEVLGRNGLEVLRTEWAERDSAEMRQVITQTGRWRGEATQMRKDGTRFPVEVSSIVVYDAGGQVSGYVSVNRDITERKRVEEILLQNQLDLDHAQEVGQIGSWRLDVHRDVLAWSDENYRIFGVPKGTALSYETFLGLVHPDDRQYVDEQWNAALHGAPYDLEHRLLIEGQVKWVREKAYLEFDDQDNLLGAFGITQDITARKLVEEALRQARDELEVRVRERTKELEIKNQELLHEIYEREDAERQLRIQTTAMEAAANGILISDFQGEIIWVNPALTRMTTYTEDELIGQNTRIFKSGMHDADYYHQMWDTVMGGNVWQGETTNRRKDSSTYIEEQTITPVRNEAGEVTHFIAIKHDVTEQKQIQAALEVERARLRNILDNIPDGVYIVNQHYEIEYINPVIEREFGPVGKQPCYLYFYDEAEPCSWCKNETVYQGERLRWEWQSKKTGKIYDVFDTPLTNMDGSLSKLKLIYDITERKRAEAELENRNRELQALSIAERQQRQTAESLRSATQALTRSLDLDTVLNTLIQFVTELVETDIASVGFVEDETRLVSRIAIGSDKASDTDHAPIFPIDAKSDFFFQKVAAAKQSILLKDATQEPDWIDFPGIEPIRSWLGVPIVVNDRVIGVLLVGKNQSGFFTDEHARSAEALVSQAAVAIQNAWLFEQVRAGRERLQLLSRRLVEVQESERRYIARELHDQAGQSLSSLILGLAHLEKGFAADEKKQAHTRELKQLANETLEDLHRLAVDLRPASLDHLGLIPSLNQLVNSYTGSDQLDVKFKAIGIGELDRLPAEVETTLYRIVQEALTNVTRHAQATRADVILEWRDRTFILIIEDNGIGFDATFAHDRTHLGLIGIRERTEMLGGNLTVESTIGSGTILVVEVPNVDSHLAGR